MQNEDYQNPELSVVILCYRAGERAEDFVRRMIETLKSSAVENYELILVGNYFKNIPDETPKVVKKLALDNPKIRFVSEPKEGMMGWDMRSGFKKASGEYIAVIDGDGQMPCEDVVRVYKKIKSENLDLVKTYRTERGDTVWRKCISWIYNIFFRVLFPGFSVRDINSKPKILERSAYEKLKLESNDWFTDAEIMIQARRLKFRVAELPTVFLGLAGRRSFVRPKAIFEFLKNLIVYRIRELRYKKEL